MNSFRSTCSTLLVTAVLWLPAATALAACVSVTTNHNTIETAQEVPPGFCAQGVAHDDEPAVFLWRLSPEDVARQWRLEISALPGQSIALKLQRLEAGDASPVLLQELRSSQQTGAASASPLILQPGAYAIEVTGDGKAFYRISAVAGDALPSAAATGQQGAFRISAAADPDGTATVPWKVDEAEARQRWTLSLQGPAGGSPELNLKGASGNPIARASEADDGGRIIIDDIGLDAGAYRIVFDGLPPGSTAVLGAEPAGPRMADFAEEPDGDLEHAHALQPDTSFSGRLTGNWDSDTFSFDSAGDFSGHRFDLSLKGPPDKDVTVELQTAKGEVLSRRMGQGQFGMSRLVLTPGRYRVLISGSLAPDQTYTLRLTDRGPMPGGEECEPNDTVQTAAAFGKDNRLHGELDGEDIDYLFFTVPRVMQLWRVEVKGAGVSRVDLLDPAGAPLASAMPSEARSDLVLSNLLLGPGPHIIAVSGHGEYRATAQPTGPPGPDEEIEPNDTIARAIAMTPGTTRHGRLDHGGDTDVYTFHLGTEERVRLGLDVVPSAQVEANLEHSDGGTSDHLARFTSPTAGKKTVWDGLLPAGDYSISLRSDGGGTSYAVAFALLPPFGPAIDLEPNDKPWQGQPVGPDLRIFGTLLDPDVDWFFLPPLEVDSKVTIIPKHGRRDLDLTIRRLDPGPYPPGAGVEPVPIANLSLDEASGTYAASLSAGEGALLRIGGPPGAYDLELVFSNGPGKRPATIAVDSRIDLSHTTITAFRPEGQRIDGKLVLTNGGANQEQVQLETFADDARWRVLPKHRLIDLEPGRTTRVPLVVEAAPDAPVGPPVRIAIRSRDAAGATGIAMATIRADSEAPPVQPFPFSALPAAMRGGFDAAWSALGAQSLDGHPGLIDGLVNNGSSVSLNPGETATIELAGTQPVPLTGVILNLEGVTQTEDRLRRFHIEASQDGTAFAEVLAGSLASRTGEQAFAFSRPVTARFLRLVPLDAQGGPAASNFRLGELKAIAASSWAPGDVLDLMRPELGGHIVWADPQPQAALTGPEAVWPGQDPVFFPEDSITDAWVVAFHDDRLATIAALEWEDWPQREGEQRIAVVNVFAATETPLGPWALVGTWQLQRDTSETALWRFDHPLSARYLRFEIDKPSGAGAISLPRRIKVMEQAGTEDYHSVLGERGEGSGFVSNLQRMVLSDGLPDAGAAQGKDAARPLPIGQTVSGSVQRGVAENWFRLEAPAGTTRIRFRLSGRPRPALSLEDSTGRVVPVSQDAGAPDFYSADVEPGAYFARITDPERSVVLSWDTSISVADYVPDILQGIRAFAREISPDREKINLVPFRGSGKPLLSGWSGDMLTVLGALDGYSVLENNSNAEAALVSANKILSGRAGAHAILLITDAQSDGFGANADLWRGFQQTRPHIFALRIPNDDTGKPARAERNLMLDWASVNGGYSKFVASRSEIRIAFARLSAWLRQPVYYSLKAETVGTPGRLMVRTVHSNGGRVQLSSTSASLSGARSDAIELILDASGSMLQRLGGKRRIDIARSALTELVTGTLPPESRVALRVFGNDRPGSCETRLAAPLAPLERHSLAMRIAGIHPKNLARTPLAASLRQVMDDLRSETGRRTVVLLTDGEESCGGDPKAEIETLAASGIETNVNIVGFAVDDAELKEKFHDWAQVGHGRYFDARDMHQLGISLRQAIEAPVEPRIRFTVHDLEGTPILEGKTNDQPAEIPAGEYRISIKTSDYRIVRDVSISNGELTTITIDPTTGASGLSDVVAK